LNDSWDQSVNDELSLNSKKLTDKQLNKIVDQYIKAVTEGLINPSTMPPF
jgi:hypothetical protein